MFIASLVIVLVTALFGKILSRKIKQPYILGELILGMILGNLGIITVTDTLSNIADIGIVFLLFSAGLTINFEEFKRLEGSSLVVAFSGVVIPFVLGYTVSVLFGFSRLIAVFVAVSLIATSVGVKAEILTELKMLETRLGTLIIGAAVIDDIIAVIFIGIIAGIARTGKILITHTFITILLALLFIVLSLTVLISVFQKLSRKYRLELANIEDILLLGVIIVLVFCVITENIGLSIITGAFMAGLVLGQASFSRALTEHATLFGESLFIPVFFVTMGMQFDVSSFASIGGFAVVLIVVAIIGKIIGCGAGAKLAKFSGQESFAVGVAMIPRAGVELLLIKLGLDYGIISLGVASVILSMVIVTTLITPPFLSTVLKRLKIKK
ncbi:MAG: cation:proton antiporter [Candidatus Methanofastidiosia archaeon]|jgi:Kef-type K+ transport system membrane component KefB